MAAAAFDLLPFNSRMDINNNTNEKKKMEEVEEEAEVEEGPVFDG